MSRMNRAEKIDAMGEGVRRAFENPLRVARTGALVVGHRDRPNRHRENAP
jgi:hypothetical protein